MHARLEQLINLRDGIPVDAEAAVHVSLCAACRAEMMRLNRWRQQLIELPVLEAPENAWQAIAARLGEYRNSSRRRYRIPGVGVALAASLAAAAVLGSWWLRAPRSPMSAATVPVSPRLAQLQSQSQYLEQVVQAMSASDQQGVTNAGTAATVAALEDRIALVDYAINQANVESQPQKELTALWQQRVNLMQSLAAVRYTQVSTMGWNP